MSEGLNDKIFTMLFVLQEVNQRLLSELIGTNIITKQFKKDFNLYLKFGEKMRNNNLKMIKTVCNEDCAELHESDADYFLDIFKASYNLETDEQFQKAITMLKNIAVLDKK